MDRDILKEYNINLADIEKEVEAIMGGEDNKKKMESTCYDSIQNFEIGSVLKGRILSSIGDNVVIDCGYKSEGMIPKFEFDDPSEIEIGEEVEVLLEAVEDDSGLIKLSKRKADRIRGWERVIDYPPLIPPFARGDTGGCKKLYKTCPHETRPREIGEWGKEVFTW